MRVPIFKGLFIVFGLALTFLIGFWVLQVMKARRVNERKPSVIAEVRGESERGWVQTSSRSMSNLNLQQAEPRQEVQPPSQVEHTGSAKVYGGINVTFATVKEGRRILTTQDEYIKRLSLFERSLRMKTIQEISEKEFLEFISRNVLQWDEDEKQKVQSALTFVYSRLEKLSLAFPKEIFIIKTTGEEEGNAAYTRSNAIILPKKVLQKSPKQLQRLISHELFHVFSRQNPKIRRDLYKTIGFEKCAETQLPDQLKSRKITNPDAPINDSCIRVEVENEALWVVPILFSTTEKDDLERGGEFLKHLQVKFLVVTKNQITYDVSNPKLLDINQLSGFFEQVGKNTEYVIHPEEILADNFVFLILEEKNVSSPNILKKMRKVFLEN